MDQISGRPPKKIFEVSLRSLTNNFTVKVLAVNEEKALKIVETRFPRMRVGTITYYGEIYK
jgi:hypothetical protein